MIRKLLLTDDFSFFRMKDKHKRYKVFNFIQLLFLFFIAGIGNAQVSNYKFTQAAGTYTSITGTTAFASGWDDPTPVNAALGFNFIYNGINYTSCSINGNGYITFGATISNFDEENPISVNRGYAGAVSALGRNLFSNSSTVIYTTIGTAPNRTFIVQWNNTRRYNLNGDFNFQIRLNESSNIVQIVYGSCATTSNTDATAQVGLRGASNADFNNRIATTNWLNSTAGTSRNSVCTTDSTKLPTNGLTYTWTPNVCTFSNFSTVAQITNVKLNTINNSSTGTTSYEDFTGVSTTLNRGQYYTISVNGARSGTNNHNYYYTAFVDWNQDGDFNDADEYYAIGTITDSNGSDGKTTSVYFNVPATAALGTTRMRVIGHYNSYNTTPCASVGGDSNGQVEDYTVVVDTGCAGYTPVGGTTLTTASTVCPNTPFKLSLQNTFPDGATYIWQTSPNGNNPWTNATGAPITFFNSDFSTPQAPNTTVGDIGLSGDDAQITGGALVLTEIAPNGHNSGFLINKANTANINPFTVSFKYRIYDGGVDGGADGLSLSYGKDFAVNPGGGESGEGSGLIVQFDTFDNEGIETGSRVRIIYNNTPIFNSAINAPFNLRTNAYKKAELSVDSNGFLSLLIENSSGTMITVVSKLFLNGYLATDKSAWKFKFSARTGGTKDRHSLDDVNIKFLDATNFNSTFTTSQTVKTFYRAQITCGGVTTSSVIPVDMISATIDPITTSTCTASAFSVTPVNGTNGTIPSGTTYTWTAPTGSVTGGVASSAAGITSITGTLTNSTATTQTATYTVTPTTSGCAGIPFILTVTVNPLPTITGTLNVCVGSTTTLTGSATANSTTPWTSATPAVATVDNSGLVTGVSVGTSVITYRNSNGCVQTATIQVNAVPTITGTASVCAGLTTQLTGSGTANATTPWTSASTAVATVSNTGLVTGIAAGTSLITYRNNTGCTQTVTVTVNAVPTITGTTGVCIGLTTQLTGSATADGIAPWTSSAPAIATITNSGLVTAIAVGTTTITYKNNNGCTVTTIVTVNALPTITGTPTVCAGSNTQLTGSGTASVTTPWTSASTAVATVSNTGLVTGVASGTSVITYRNNNGCTQTFTVTVNDRPTAPIAGTITHPSCLSNTGSVVLSGLPSTGTWTLTRTPDAITSTGTGDTTTITGLAANTTYTYTVSNGTCTSVSTANIVINPLPLVATWNAGWTNGPPTINQPVIFSGDYSSSGDVNACSCTVNTGANVVFNSGNTLKVTNALIVASGASLTFENNSSLVQTNDAAVNSGNIAYKRTTKNIRLSDYTYWSTPVSPQKLVNVSSQTLFDKYFGYNGTNWVLTNSNTVMQVGKGYIIRGPQTYSNTARLDYTARFEGTPNNGVLNGETVQANKPYLVGNPYPSALNVFEFLDANRFLNGTLYFWTHNTPLTPGVLKYKSDDYAAYNLSGGVGTSAPTGSGAGNNSDTPSGHVAAGQSFFIEAAGNGTVVFTNKMREGGADNTQFFKPGKTSKETGATAASRIWLNMTNTDGAFKQMLVSYIAGATNDYEDRYDGKTFDGNAYVDFYSINNNLNFVIQGRALPFTDTDLVPLGYRSTIAGDFSIAINQTEGELVNQSVYLEDKTTGKIHDLKAGSYTFTTAIGTFADRFVLRYTNKTLGTGDFENTDDNLIVSVKTKVIKVTSVKENIKEVNIYDISGKLLYSKNKVNATELQIQNLQSANQVLLVKVTLENNYTTTRKTIFQ